MSATRTSSVASNFACETLLSKSSDSTYGISGVSGSTGLNKASAYVINSGNDVTPVIQGIVSFTASPIVPAGLLIGSATVTALANATAQNLLPVFPATCSGTYMIDFVCTTPGQQWNTSSVGRIIRTAGTVSEINGFQGTAVGSALLGTSPNQTVAFIEIASNSSGSLSLYNGTGVALTGTVTVYKIASAN